MSKYVSRRIVISGVGVSMLFAMSASGVAAAATEDSPDYSKSDSQQVSRSLNGSIISAAIENEAVEGVFSFAQGVVASNDEIVKIVDTASKYLCGSGYSSSGEVESAEDWQIEITGDVDNPYITSMGEFSQTEIVQHMVMGCSCAGNDIDGHASFDAFIEGIPAYYFIDTAQPCDGVNTVVFASVDGYEISLPLQYLYTHFCPIVFNINGSPLVETVGGSNQLWLGSTPGSYFARDIVSIRLETRLTPPPTPTSDEAREKLQTLPNIGIRFGGEIG